MTQKDLPVWDLSNLYKSPDDARLKDDLKALDEHISEFEDRYRGAFTTKDIDFALLALAIKSYERIFVLAYRLQGYAYLYYCTNTTNSEKSVFYSNILEKTHMELLTRLNFFPIDLNKLSDTAIEDGCLANADIKAYVPFLRQVRNMKAYQLSEEIEKLLAQKSYAASSAWHNLHNQLMGQITMIVDDETISLETGLQLLTDASAEKRSATWQKLIKSFTTVEHTFASTLNAVVKDKQIDDEWRGFKSPEMERHIANEVEPEIVDTLVDVVTSSYPKLSHRYYSLKAKWMNREKLEFWSTSAPLIAGADEQHISWAKARDVVLQSFFEFSPKIADLAKGFFDSDRIHARQTPGKVSGAFCASHHEIAYILVNYNYNSYGVSTLSHELGHGIHFELAKHNNALNHNVPMTLAETASVFCEILTFQSLLRAIDDRSARVNLLASAIEDNLLVNGDTIARYLFEKKLYAARENGELTSDDISDLWRQTKADFYGPGVEMTPGCEKFWCSKKHHFQWPFYVYAYAFGDCLVKSLYNIYLDGRDGFVDDYIDMLAAGGTKRHKELLAPFGIDLSDRSFWQKSTATTERMIDQLEQLMADN